MSEKTNLLHDIALLPTGTALFERYEGQGARKWVYQRTGKGFGNLGSRGTKDLQIRKHVIPRDPRTLAQIIRRQRMAAGVARWHTLASPDQDDWKARGLSRAISGFNAFISDWMLSTPPYRSAEAVGLTTTKTALDASASAPAGASAEAHSAAGSEVSADAYGINFGNTFYIGTAAESGAALGWGDRIFKLRQQQSETEDGSTRVTQAALTSNQTRTLSPYQTVTTNRTAGSVGWAVDPAEMLSTSYARRYIPAGNHTLIIPVSVPNPLDGSTFRGEFNAYRVGVAPERARALLGSVAWAKTMSGGKGLINQSLMLDQITFEQDETLQYEIVWSASAIVLVALTLTFTTGRSGGASPVDACITFPGLKTEST